MAPGCLRRALAIGEMHKPDSLWNAIEQNRGSIELV